MTETFLRAPHWKLFVLSFGVPFLLQLLGTTVSFSNLASFSGVDSMPAWPYYLSSAGSLAIGAVLYGWTWSVGHGLQKRMPLEFRRPTIGFATLVTTLALLCVGSVLYTSNVPLLMEDTRTMTVLLWTLIPLLLVWMVAHLYCAAYVADLILTAENEREPGFHELVHLSLLIWLFPVGIWIVQPRVNRLARAEHQEVPHMATEMVDSIKQETRHLGQAEASMLQS